MNNLEVFAFKHQSVVDSRDVAEAVERPHRQLLRSIQTMIKHLEHNGTERKSVLSTKGKISVSAQSNERIFAPVKYFIPATYLDEKGEARPCFYCTRLGCDLVANKMTGEKGTLFTAAYVTRFHEMDKELTKRAALRELSKPTQRTLTDAIRDSGEGERMKGHAYNTYINLAYKAALGKNAGQLRQERDADKKARAVDFLTSDELQAVERIKQGIIILLDAHLSYDAIRFALLGEVHS